MKYCGKCQTEKPLTDFSKRKLSKDGLQIWCRTCLNSETLKNAVSRKQNGPTIQRDSKVCFTCGLKKPITQFHRKRGYSADGYGSYCKPCWTTRVKGSRARVKATVHNG